MKLARAKRAEGYGAPAALAATAALAAAVGVLVALATANGAGALGFSGTAEKDPVLRAAGLTALAGGEFGGGPRMPMVPGTWDHAGDGPDRESGTPRKQGRRETR